MILTQEIVKNADLVIHNGRIIKNRYGLTGGGNLPLPDGAYFVTPYPNDELQTTVYHSAKEIVDKEKLLATDPEFTWRDDVLLGGCIFLCSAIFFCLRWWIG